MKNAETQTQSQLLTDKLHGYAENNLVPSEFVITSLRKDIKALKISHADEGYMLSGMLECVLGNIDGVIENHSKSLTLNSSSVFYKNYISSLMGLFDHPTATTVLIEGLKYNPNSITLHSTACILYLRLGLVRQSLEHYEQLKKLTLNSKIDPNVIFSVNEAKLYQSLNLSEPVISRSSKIRDSIFDKHKIKQYSLDIMGDEDDITFFIGIDGSPEMIACINDELCDYLSENKPIKGDITIIFNPMDS